MIDKFPMDMKWLPFIATPITVLCIWLCYVLLKKISGYGPKTQQNTPLDADFTRRDGNDG
jgi:hypothetical protein